MTVDALTATLASQGVMLYLEGDALRFRAPKGVLTAEVKHQVVKRRTEIVAQLRSPTTLGAQSRDAACRCDMAFWVDEPSQDARIRTHCGKCGKFIGHRPENLSNDRNKALEPGRPV